MKKFYTQPELEVRNYVLPSGNLIMTSNTGDGNGGGGGDLESGGDMFE